MGKIIGGVVAVVVILIAVVAGIFYFNLDKIIIAAVEKYGSEVTQTDVVLDEVDLDLTSGKGALKGFSVANPSGFDEQHAVQFNTVAVNVDIPNTNDKLIHITEIRIEQPAITYEVNETTNNLDAIKKNVDTFMKENGMGGGEQKEEASSEEGPKLIIDNIYINGGKVTVKSPILLNQKVEGNLPDIHMKDIGKSEGGASPDEVAAQLINEISSQAMAVVTNLGIGKTMGTLLDNAGDLANKVGVGAAAGKAGEISKDAAKSATDAVDGAGKSLKKLLSD
ncbi:MAG: hypothetical protein V7723_08050 [Sneathiella sp.]|uniref:hypothetical protein n=1 Tax=Sneathiella sp. TaxID=1964365 RepID=UPI003002AE81